MIARTVSLAVVLSLTAGASFALAQDEPAPADDPPAASEQDEAEKKAAGGLGSLDDLLGIEDEPPGADTPPGDDAEAIEDAPTSDELELERALSMQEARQALVQAAQQMNEATLRLRRTRDTGVVTQRLHNEIIDKLDVLIKQAEQQQSQSSSSSSSSSSSQSQSQMQQGAQQQGQRQQQQQSQTQPGDESSPIDGERNMEFREGRLDQFDATGAAWGALPERVRERLLESSNDRFSSLYEALTEAYYRKLAEDSSQ
jgi:hypothetical protein